MNYYNPYFYSMPSISAPKVGIFSKLLGGSGLTFGSILNGTQRALNFANQAIPLVKQVKPVIGNAKTMFKVMNEFKRAERPINNNYSNTETVSDKVKLNDNTAEQKSNNLNNNDDLSKNGPTFFI